VLTRRGLLRAVWSRSAPALAGAAIVAVRALAICLLIGSTTVVIEGEPTPTEWVVLAVVLLALPLAFTVGWIVAQIGSRRAGRSPRRRRSRWVWWRRGHAIPVPIAPCST
jgi:hypothetical protein